MLGMFDSNSESDSKIIIILKRFIYQTDHIHSVELYVLVHEA